MYSLLIADLILVVSLCNFIVVYLPQKTDFIVTLKVKTRLRELAPMVRESHDMESRNLISNV